MNHALIPISLRLAVLPLALTAALHVALSPSAEAAGRTYTLDYVSDTGGPATATGFITIDTSVVPNPGETSNASAATLGVIDFQLTVANASSGNGTFGMSDVTRWIWDAPVALDFDSDLRPQLTDFNLGTIGQSPGAPNGDNFFLIRTNNRTGDTLTLRSMCPAKVVTNANDSGPGSLRDAIANLGACDTVVFDPQVFNGEAGDVITLATPITISDATLTIDASRLCAGVTVSGGNSSKILTVTASANVTIEGVHFRDGSANSPGFSGSCGAAILTNGTLVVRQSTFSGCFALDCGGAIRNDGDLTAINCTFHNNTADGDGGALSTTAAGPSTFINCTVTGNSSPAGGGLSNMGGTLTLENTIVAGNTGSASEPDIAQRGTLISGGGNLIGIEAGVAANAGLPNGNGDYVGTAAAPLDPMLNPLGRYGGPTPTRLPVPGSLALENGLASPDTPSTDQRGEPRPVGTLDIGAVEIDWNANSLPAPWLNFGSFFDVTQPGDPVAVFTASTPAKPGGEKVANAIDDNVLTKYLNFSRLNTGLDVTPQLGATRIVGLGLTSANDAPFRDPATFILLGLKPGGGTEFIAAGEVPVFSGRRVRQELFFAQPSNAFASYRLIFPTVANEAGANSMQIAEVELLGARAERSPQLLDFDLVDPNDPTKIWSMTWSSLPGRVYALEFSDDLENWIRWTDQNSQGLTTGFGANDGPLDNRFHRVVDLHSPLWIDFNSTNQDGGPHPQGGFFQNYDAGHEVAADFDTKSYSAFGTTIDITPDWPNTTDNRVRQMIDRTAGFDNNWNDASGDLQLVTDFLGIDTRTANGGNGNWDGDLVGTPTYMTLTLSGLPAGDYDWTSFHHDTEHVHTLFQVEVSTDGGASFTNLGQNFYMSDSTAGGNPDSALDGSLGLQVGPGAVALPSTARINFTANGTDDIVLRFAPLSGTLGNAVHNQLWGINGFGLERR